MALNDFEYSYNGLTFGGATQWGVTHVEGLGPTDAKDDVIEKTGADGAFVFAQWYVSRVVLIEGDLVVTPSAAESTLDTLRTTFANRTADSDLDFKLPGVVTRRIKCRPRRRDWNIDEDYQIGYISWRVEFIAGDPAIYNVSNTKVFNS